MYLSRTGTRQWRNEGRNHRLYRSGSKDGVHRGYDKLIAKEREKGANLTITKQNCFRTLSAFGSHRLCAVSARSTADLRAISLASFPISKLRFPANPERAIPLRSSTSHVILPIRSSLRDIVRGKKWPFVQVSTSN